MDAIAPVAKHVPEGAALLKEHQVRFMAAKRLHWRAKTLENYRVALDSYVAHAGADHWPPTADGILDWLEAVRDRASETTAASYWGHARAFLNYLEETGAIDDNPARTIKRLRLAPRAPRKGPVAFSHKEVNTLFAYLAGRLPALDARRDLALLHLLYVTGMRSGEVCTLRWTELDLDEYTVTIQALVAKSGNGRLVYFCQTVRAELGDWRRWLRGEGYNAPWVFPALHFDNHRKVCRLTGRPLTIYGLNQMFHRRLEEAGIPHRKVHALRHSHILHALQFGIPIDQVRDQVGHRNIQSTEAYLSGWDEDRKRSYRNFLGGNIDSA